MLDYKLYGTVKKYKKNEVTITEVRMRVQVFLQY